MSASTLDFRALEAPQQLAPEAIGPWLELLAGAVRRTQPNGAPAPRLLCKELFTDLLTALSRHPGWEEELALLDWWLVALGHDGPLGYAWLIEEQLTNKRLGQALAALLNDLKPGLIGTLRRPLRRAELREELESFLQHRPRLKKTPGPELLKEVMSEVRELLDADEAGQAAPRLDLFDLDPEEFASTERNRARLERRLKVWNSLVKHVTFLQERARELATLTGPGRQVDPVPLPPGWREWAGTCRLPGLAEAILGELERLQKGDGQAPLLFAPSQPLDRLRTLPTPAPGLEQRARLLALVDEALLAAPEASEPDWATLAHSQVEELRRRIRALLTQARALELTDAVAGLELALDELLSLRIRAATEWQEDAQRQVNEAQADEAVRRKSKHFAELQAVLQELDADLDALEAEPDLDHRIRAATQQVDAIREALADRKKVLDHLLVPDVHREAARDRLAAVQEALNADELPSARRRLQAADEFVQAAREAAQSALLPSLRKLEERAARAPLPGEEREGLSELLERIGLRAEEELPHEQLLEAAEAFVEAAEGDRLDALDVLCEVGRVQGLMTAFEVHLLAWADTGIAFSPTRLERRTPRASREVLGELQTGQLFVAQLRREVLQQDGSLALKSRPRTAPEDRWSDVVGVGRLDDIHVADLGTYPGCHDLSAPFYCLAGDRVQGPLEAWGEEERPLPQDPRGFVARLPYESFKERYGLVTTPGKRRLVPYPPGLDELLGLDDAEPVDHQDAAATQRWLADLLEAHSGSSAPAVARALTLLEASGQQLPRPILRSRVARLADFLAVSRDLERVRERAAADYLATEDGSRVLQRVAERIATRETQALEAEVARRRTALEGDLARTQEELLRLGARLDDVRTREAEARAELEGKLTGLRQEVQAAEELLADRKARLLAELMGAREPQRGSSEPKYSAALRADADPALSVGTLEEGFQLVRAGLAGWQDFDVANLLVTVLTNPWTLLAGPPGVGKSSFARALLTRMGHGPASPRYLELVVRRDWHDDAPLFGFWHPEQGRWCPSSEGLVEHLLTALDDQRRGHGGFYPCVLEELNLAPPEHYLARLISALEDSEPRVRLYASTQSPTNEERYPAAFPLPGNVRLIGTVNVDETVQALSPRFLSRAAVIWMSPDMDRLLTPPAAPAPPDLPVSWSSLESLLPSTRPELGHLLAVVRYLHDNRVPGAPTPRTLRGMERYLAVATSLMPESVAQDFQVAQRILPTLRGVGERYREVYDGLARLLRKHGWTQAATRCEEIRARGEELGDFYDFFHA